MNNLFLEGISSNFEDLSSFQNFSVLSPNHEYSQRKFWSVFSLENSNHVVFLDEIRLAKRFNKDGQKESMTVYIDNDEIYTEWSPAGIVLKNGRYRNGKQNDLWFFNYQEGSSEVNFKNGVRDGLAVYYYLDGKIFSEGKYKDNLKEGLWIDWYDSEERQIQSKENYQKYEKNGLWEEWYENGNRKLYGNYQDDRKIGKWSYWGPDGRLLKTRIYKYEENVWE